MVTRGVAVCGERVLSAKSVEAMCEQHTPCEPGQSYGYGLVIRPGYHGVTLVGHNGTLRGFAAHFLVVPERDLTGIVFTNLPGTPQAQILLSALNLHLNIPLETPRVSYREYACPPERLPLYAGRYRADEGQDMTVQVENGRLILNDEGYIAEATPVGDHQFTAFVAGQTALYQFLLDQGDRSMPS